MMRPRFLPLSAPSPTPGDAFVVGTRRMNDATPVTLVAAQEGQKTFVPISRSDIIDGLLSPERWANESEVSLARAVFYKIGCLRQHQSAVALNELFEAYDPFNPDDDTLNQEELSVEQRTAKRGELVTTLRKHALSANYEEITPKGLEIIMSNATPDGVHVEVDFSEFEVKLLFFRGEGDLQREKRDIARLYLRKKTYAIPVYNRLLMALKFKTEEVRIAELMKQHDIDEATARKRLKKLRRHFPKSAATEHVYLKIFKNIPCYDVEMLFPNIRVKMKYSDKLQLGGSALVGTLTWALGTATKLLVAVALSPLMLGVALLTGFGGIIYAQIRNIFITRDRYRMQLAQSLYFQNLANNQGALALIVDEAEEEDVKEEVLLYSHLLAQPIPAGGLDALDRKIEAFLGEKFNINVNFDVEDALQRLLACGLVVRSADGELRALPLPEADRHLRQRWCGLVDAMDEAA
jgi:predicted transcriptional regulator